MTRDAAEVIVRAQFDDQYIDEQYTQILDDAAEEYPDREMVAGGLWMLGAGLEHPGCIYGPPEPADGDYSCACEQCWTHLLAVADRIIAAVHEPIDPSPEEVRAAQYRERMGDLTDADDEALAHSSER